MTEAVASLLYSTLSLPSCVVFKAVSILVTLELAAVLFQCPNLSLAKVLVSNSNTEQLKLTLFEVSVHTCYSIRVLL